jgi:hypothetical protein
MRPEMRLERLLKGQNDVLALWGGLADQWLLLFLCSLFLVSLFGVAKSNLHFAARNRTLARFFEQAPVRRHRVNFPLKMVPTEVLRWNCVSEAVLIAKIPFEMHGHFCVLNKPQLSFPQFQRVKLLLIPNTCSGFHQGNTIFDGPTSTNLPIRQRFLAYFKRHAHIASGNVSDIHESYLHLGIRTSNSEVEWIHFNDGTERTDQLLASERECILCDLRGLLHLGQLASGEKGVKARSDKEQATEQSN